MTVVAKNFLCFDALLEMIVADAGIPTHFSQDDFAELFGITIPVGETTTVKNVKYSENEEEYGTHICVSEINAFFKKECIPLHLSFIKSNYINELNFNDFILSNTKKAHIIFAFCYGILFDEPQNNNIGHVALFEHFDEKTDTIKIYDPGPHNAGIKTVKTDDLLYAMKRRGGIYFFEKEGNDSYNMY